MKKIKILEPLSDFDLSEFATKHVGNTLKKQGYVIDYMFTNPNLPDWFARIWFITPDGEKAWVVIRYEVNKDIKNVKAPNMRKPAVYSTIYDGYFAPIIFEYKGKEPYNDGKTKIKHLPQIITKIYDSKTHQFL